MCEERRRRRWHDCAGEAVTVHLVEGRDAAMFTSPKIKATCERAIEALLQLADGGGGPLHMGFAFASQLKREIFGSQRQRRERHIRSRRGSTRFEIRFAPGGNARAPFTVHDRRKAATAMRTGTMAEALAAYPYALPTEAAQNAANARQARADMAREKKEI